ncbi:alpha-ketoglutarate-dependent dioxygenase AlkB family protein [Vibrio sp.]|uniref:alpha-ketoglutarate-dependent dioxygenase AlkB family protein n=1 Tax=Vibrio sp. TaxID=678 RepID=UPI003D103B61
MQLSSHNNPQAFAAGDIVYWPDFICCQQAHTLFEQLMNQLEWQQLAIAMFGRKVLQPRLQAWYGEHSYRYSGLTLEPRPWTEQLLNIKQQCETISGAHFNTVLANLYRDGADYMGWHQDNEPELGPGPVIASVSLGETRRFLFRHKRNKQKLEFELPSGSLLLMRGDCQNSWQHSLPKTRKPKKARINLTFRQILTRS